MIEVDTLEQSEFRPDISQDLQQKSISATSSQVLGLPPQKKKREEKTAEKL